MHITLERGRFVAAAAVLAASFGLAGPWLAAQPRAAATGNWPQFRGPNRDGKSADTNLLKQWDADGPALAWKVSGLGTGYSSLVDRRRPPLHDGGPGGQPVRHRPGRGRRQAALEGQGRADLAGPYPGPRGDADRRRRR